MLVENLLDETKCIKMFMVMILQNWGAIPPSGLCPWEGIAPPFLPIPQNDERTKTFRTTNILHLFTKF